MFDAFKATHGPGIRYATLDAAEIDAFRGQLPDELLDDWRDNGLCHYVHSFIWFVNPATFAEALVSFVGERNDAWVFARTGFGDLIAWSPAGVSYIDVRHGTVYDISPDLEFYIEHAWTSDEYLDDAMDRPLYLDAIQTLGEPSADECLGFFPALALGGPGTVDTLQRVNLFAHLAILAQL